MTLKKKLTILAAALIALAIIAGLSLSVANAIARQRSNAIIKALHKSGVPVTWKQLDASYRLPENVKNDADLLLAAFDLLPEPDDVQSSPDAFLEANQPLLEALEFASSFENCRFDLNFSQGFRIELPHLSAVRDFVKSLALKAEADASKKNGSGGIDNIVAAARLSESLRMEPLLMSQLVRSACERLTIKSLRRVMSNVPVTDGDLIRVNEALERWDDSEQLQRAFVGERCLMLIEAEKMRKLPYVGDIDLLEGLRLFEDFIAASKMPYAERRVPAKSIWRQLSQPLTPFLGRFFYAYERALNTDGIAEASRLNAIVALATERYRLKYGTLPQSLEDLSPEFMPSIPLDPFGSGARPLYRLTDDGFVVYSLGPNRIDNGGENIENDRESDQFADVTFVVTTPTPISQATVSVRVPDSPQSAPL